MDIRYGANPSDSMLYTTQELRQEYLIESVFVEGGKTITYSHIDRIIILGITPTTKAIPLDDEGGACKELGTDFFLERREIAIINIGGSGIITVDGEAFPIGNKDGLYIGKGVKSVSFASADGKNPSKFYCASTPAHKTYPTFKVDIEKANARHIGEEKTANKRTIFQFFHPDVLPTCQITMGMTKLEEGSVWNTMPSHTHERRMEVYMYFDMPDDMAVFHYMGTPQETRHIVMTNEQAVISPSWSIHSGCGTRAYTFIWAMCGENQTFDDMDHIKNTDLR